MMQTAIVEIPEDWKEKCITVNGVFSNGNVFELQLDHGFCELRILFQHKWVDEDIHYVYNGPIPSPDSPVAANDGNRYQIAVRHPKAVPAKPLADSRRVSQFR
jgi:hypothetical protein